MLRSLLPFAFVWALLLNVPSVWSQTPGSDPSGTWRWEYDVDGKTREDSVSLQWDNGKLSGSFRGQPEKAIAIRDSSWKDGQVLFGVEYKHKDQSVSLLFRGKLKGDELSGTVSVTTDGGSEEYPWTPKRSVRTEDVVGKWMITIDANGNVLQPMVTFSKEGAELGGKYKVTEANIVDASRIKIRDNKLEFRIEATIDGRKIRADYSGRPYGDSMKGMVEYDLDGAQGEIEFSAKREK